MHYLKVFNQLMATSLMLAPLTLFLLGFFSLFFYHSATIKRRRIFSDFLSFEGICGAVCHLDPPQYE